MEEESRLSSGSTQPIRVAIFLPITVAFFAIAYGIMPWPGFGAKMAFSQDVRVIEKSGNTVTIDAGGRQVVIKNADKNPDFIINDVRVGDLLDVPDGAQSKNQKHLSLKRPSWNDLSELEKWLEDPVSPIDYSSEMTALEGLDPEAEAEKYISQNNFKVIAIWRYYGEWRTTPRMFVPGLEQGCPYRRIYPSNPLAFKLSFSQNEGDHTEYEKFYYKLEAFAKRFNRTIVRSPKYPFSYACSESDRNNDKKNIDRDARRSASLESPHLAAFYNFDDLLLEYSKRGGLIDLKDAVWDSTPLYIAARFNRLDAAKALIDLGADPFSFPKDSFESSPFDAAIIFGGYEVFELFMATDGIRSYLDQNGARSVTYALRRDRLEIVDRILELSPDLNVIAERQQLPLIEAGFKEDLELMEKLLKAGANPHALNYKLSTAYGFFLDRWPEAIDLMDRYGFQVAATEEERIARLFKAIHAGELELIEELLDKQANRELLRKSISSAIHRKKRRRNPPPVVNYIEVIELIMAHGAAPVEAAIEAKDIGDLELLNRFLAGMTKEEVTKVFRSFFVKEPQGNDGNAIFKTLIEHGADTVSVWSYNWMNDTPLHTFLHRHSRDHGWEERLQMLIETGPDLNKADYKGNTPLHRIARGKPEKIAEFLKYGPDPNVKNHYGRTPLFYVTDAWTRKKQHYDKSLRRAELLLASGADPMIKDRWGNTALDFAKVHAEEDAGFLPVVELLAEGLCESDGGASHSCQSAPK